MRIALDPKLAEAHLQLGNLYSDENKYAEVDSGVHTWRVES